MTDSILITFETSDGKKVEVQARTGISVMEAAVMNNITGIEAECGGACICATCHVYCKFPSGAAVDEMSLAEDDMLDLAAAERQEASRLSCQLQVSKNMHGAVFVIPEGAL